MAVQGDSAPELRDLVFELKIVDWYDLGIQLNVTPSKLRTISRENPTEARRLAEMLEYWLNNEKEPSWKKIITALQRVSGHNNIITAIQTKYKYSIPPQKQATVVKPKGDRNSDSAVSGTDRLTEAHLPQLLIQMTQNACEWKQIGYLLGFHTGEINSIVGQPQLLKGAPDSWLRALLEKWLQWAPGDKRGSTEYASLKALKRALNNRKLASELKLT